MLSAWSTSCGRPFASSGAVLPGVGVCHPRDAATGTTEAGRFALATGAGAAVFGAGCAARAGGFDGPSAYAPVTVTRTASAGARRVTFIGSRFYGRLPADAS